MVESHAYCLAFSALIRERWKELNAFTTAHRFKRDQAIYFVGDPAEAMYLIESGLVKVVRLSPDGKEKITDIYQPGDLFGEVCLCERGARAEQAIALRPLTVTSFNVKEVLKLLQKRQELALNLLMLFCARLVECQEQTAALAFDGVDRRLAKEMLRLSRLAATQPEKGGVRLSINLTHQELAHLVNTTRENVTAIMNQFRRQGMLDYSREKTLVFPNRVEAYLKKSRS